MNRIKNRTERSAAIKMLVIFACFIGLAGLIIGRLAEYQLKMYDYYQTKVLNQLTIQTDVTPERGTIMDRNGNILATNKTVYNVLLSPQDIINRVEKDKKSVKARAEFLQSKEFRELTDEEKEFIANGFDCNNSDIDFCDYNGKTVIMYSWGNQYGKEFLAMAEYDGSLQELLESHFLK